MRVRLRWCTLPTILVSRSIIDPINEAAAEWRIGTSLELLGLIKFFSTLRTLTAYPLTDPASSPFTK